MDATFFTRLLPDDLNSAPRHERVRAALALDPALAGRVSWDDAGRITLTGPAGGRPPASVKERQRWEMHVRLRIAAELDEETSAGVVVRWADATDRQVASESFLNDSR